MYLVTIRSNETKFSSSVLQAYAELQHLGCTGVRPSVISEPTSGVVVDTYFINEEDEAQMEQGHADSEAKRFELASVGTPLAHFLDAFSLKMKLLPHVEDPTLESKRGMGISTPLAQSTNEVLMMVPAAFESNVDAAQVCNNGRILCELHT